LTPVPALLPLFILAAACAPADTGAGPEPDMVLADVTVIDGTGAAPVPGRTIEITDSRITAIRASVPGDSGTVDVAGSFVVPGLIDSHVHLPQDPDAIRAALDSMLSAGITAGREMACCAPDYVEVLSRPDSAELARLYWSAFWAGPPFLSTDLRFREIHGAAGEVPWLRTVTDTTDLATAARGALESGATAIKIYSNMDPPLVRAIARAAGDVGLGVWSHAAVFPTRPSEVVASGVEVLSHAAFLVWEVPDQMPTTYNGGHEWNAFGPPAPYATVSPDDPRVVAVLEAMRERGAILDPTILVMGFQSMEARSWGIEVARRAHEMGIPIAAGTDSRLLFDEIEALVFAVGMSPLEAIESATSVGAAAIGVEDDLGTIEVGKVADMVLYPADPTEDITVLREPSRVIRSGRLVRSGS
jgi:imidazolonepropionase-like amidohydrolase